MRSENYGERKLVVSYSHNLGPANYFELVTVPGMAWLAVAVTVAPSTVPTDSFKTAAAVTDWAATQDAAPTLAWTSGPGGETEHTFRERVTREMRAAGMSGVTVTIFSPKNYWEVQENSGTGRIPSSGIPSWAST